MTIFNFYASRSGTPLLTLTLTVRFSAPLFLFSCEGVEK